MTRTVIIRCDASPEIGFGHLVRCLALAEGLRQIPDWKILFAMNGGALEMVEEAGFCVIQPQGGFSPSYGEDEWLESLVGDEAASIVILDVRTDLTARLLRERHPDCVIVVLDDPGERRLSADLAFYPPAPQMAEMTWDGFRGSLYSGWEWVILRSDFDRPRAASASRETGVPRVLVTMGGSDPAGLTLPVLRALTALGDNFDADVVLGPGFQEEEAVRSYIMESGSRFRILTQTRSMADLMEASDLAIASFGMSAYELASLGVPAVYLCLSGDHEASAGAFVAAGIAVSLGHHRSVSAAQIQSATRSLLVDSPARRLMGSLARSTVDAKGAGRITKVIQERAEAG